MIQKHKRNDQVLLGSFQYVHPARYVAMLLFFTTLVGSCAAQSDLPVILIPVIAVIFMFGGFGSIFCIFFFCCLILVTNRNMNRRSRERSAQQVNYPQTRSTGGGPRPYPVQPSYPQSYPVQSNYPQTHPVPPQTYPVVPSQLAYTEPQPVSLPEATLHQGDAPPGYEEAINYENN